VSVAGGGLKKDGCYYQGMVADLNPVWVDTPEGVDEVAEAVARAGKLALDTEADSLHSYFHKTCLVQITAGSANFVVDPLSLEPDELRPLWRWVEDDRVPVLMHGADYDIRVLDRDYSVRVKGLVDTQIMAQVLGEKKTGLAALLEKELGVSLDKRYQRADWGRRPLPVSQITYAAADTAHLEALASRLGDRLASLGRSDWAVEECRRLEQVRHRAAEPDPLAFERVKGVRALRGASRDRAFSLFQWRDGEARRLDIPPFKVLGNRQLLELATTAPSNNRDLAGIDGLGPRFVRRWGAAVLEVLRRPDRSPARVRKARQPELSAAEVRRVKRLTAARDEAATQLGMDPGLVCPKACIAMVATASPPGRTEAGLRRLGLTGWRLEVLGRGFLAALGSG